MKRLCIVTFALLLFCSFGCASGPSVCDSLNPGDSVLCDAVSGSEYRLEDAGNALILANAVAIGEGWYTREEAIELCQDLIQILKLEDLINPDEIKEMLNEYPGLWDVLSSYVSTSVPEVNIYRTDRNIIISWLGDRIKSMEE